MYFDMVINMYTYNVIDLCNNGFVGYDVTTKLANCHYIIMPSNFRP